MRKSKKLVVKRETIRTLTAGMVSRARGGRDGDDDCTARMSGCWTGDCAGFTEDCSICCSYDCY